MMEIQELKKSRRQNAKLLAGRYAGIALLLGHVVGVHSTATWSKGLGVPPAIKVEGDMCGGLNGIYMYSDLWEPHSNLFNGKDTSAPMYMREALLCSDGDAYHGLKCGKDNEGRCFFFMSFEKHGQVCFAHVRLWRVAVSSLCLV